MQIGFQPYQPPDGGGASRPAVIMWFRVYAAMTLLLYVGFLVLWLAMATSGGATGQSDAIFALIIILGVVFVFGGFYAVAALVPFKPWGWTVGLVAICLGMTSCMAVFAVPLLIYWMKPETKAAFCRV